ncbi:MAG TPA: multicopper oxidase domain-containing protein [Polyangiaceae bacterium]|nr:multicopper oxidase domain-containing protein [Polyangiaceae bacterium]
MSFSRISILGSGALPLLLQLVACSARTDSEPSATRDASARAEHADPEGGESPAQANQKSTSEPLDPLSIPKWRTVLEKPPVYAPKLVTDNRGAIIRQDYRVSVREDTAQMLPDGYPATRVLAYGGLVSRAGSAQPVEYRGSPGATFEMTRGIPARVEWVNEITTPHFLPVDPTLHWANPNELPSPTSPFLEFPEGYPQAQSNVPYVTHLHGLEVASSSDGNPEAWYTASGTQGPKYDRNVYDYPNSQPATALWYHDHTLGMTRLNVYAGLAGMYIIRDPRDPVANPTTGVTALPDAAHEMPLVIQDKSFNSDGTLAYPNAGFSPEHPYWTSGFDGNTNVVNGKVWPEMKVERTRYRFRVLNGANTRYYNLSLSNGQPLIVIGSDGGYLEKPVEAPTLLLAPGERADVLVDFSNLEPGQELILKNDSPDQLGEVVRFTVPADAPKLAAPPPLPESLNEIPELTTNVPKRTVTLHSAPDGSYLLDGQMFDSAVSETPKIGATEDWDIVNLTYLDHPIHLHLVQFRLVQRQGLDDAKYTEAWTALNDSALPLHQPTVKLDVDPYLVGTPTPPTATEAGWKDTVVAPGMSVTRIRVRWAPQEAPMTTAPGTNAFAFDPTEGPGYVWHCHMLEHEDNEMMRPLRVVK